MEYKIVRIDPRSITPDAITFADGTLTINIPQWSYKSGCPYFLRLIDEIPSETTIGADVVITIGTGTVEYPLLDCQGVQVTAERLRTGYSYPVAVVGSGANGAFKILAPLVFRKFNAAVTLDGTAPEGGAGA